MSQRELTPQFVRDVKLRLLRMHFDAGVGHIGGNLSCIDVLLCLYHRIMGPDDGFVLSKGHAAGALYATLWSVGAIDEAELLTFHKDETRLSGHPPASAIPQIEFATGSLGHGLGLATGTALARRLRNEPGHVFCLMSDGEWNEGSCWEALIFAQQQRLNNLTFIVDVNGLQGFGSTKDVADLEPLTDKFRAFGVQTIEVDGHDLRVLTAILKPPIVREGPRCILARTRKGCGVSFMEGRMEWHYLPMTPALFEAAANEIRTCANAG